MSIIVTQFAYEKPATWEELFQHLGGQRERAVLYAGGTDLLVLIRAGKVSPGLLLDVKRLPGIGEIREEQDFLEIGAACPFSAIASHEAVGRWAPTLAQAARSVGSTQIRFKGTLGGNIGTASPAGDGLTAAWGLDAALTLAGAEGTRTAPLCEFITGPRKTCLREGECIRSIRIAKHPWSFQRFFKVGRRNALAISVTNGMVALDVSRDGLVREARIALGAVGPTPLRLRSAEALVAGRRRNDVDLEAVARRVREEVAPIDDIRAGAAYRAYISGVWVRRLLEEGLGGNA